MGNISTSAFRSAGLAAVALLALVGAACTPGLPAPVIALPPVTGTSDYNGGGGSMANIVGCLPAGGVVTAEVTRLDTGPGFNDAWWLQVRELGSSEEDASFPWQEIIVPDGADHTTLVSDPVPAGACVQILVQAPGYFDLPSPRFNYTVTW